MTIETAVISKLNDSKVHTNSAEQLPKEFFKKPHQLVFSDMDFSPREHDMFALFLSRLHKEHWEAYAHTNGRIPSPTYIFDSSVLVEWFGVSSSKLYTILEPPADRLTSKRVGVKNDENSEFEYHALFKTIKYKNGQLTIIPNDQLMSVYINMSKGHAQVSHKVFRQLKSEHSKRLYTILSRFKTKGLLQNIPLKELQVYFGVVNKKGEFRKKGYSRTNTFIKHFIVEPIKEIAKTEPLIDFSYSESGSYGYETITQGRRIVAIQFLYRWKDSELITNEQRNESGSITKAKDKHFFIQMYQDISQESIESLAQYEKQDFLDLMMQYVELEKEGYVFDHEFKEKCIRLML